VEALTVHDTRFRSEPKAAEGLPKHDRKRAQNRQRRNRGVWRRRERQPSALRRQKINRVLLDAYHRGVSRRTDSGQSGRDCGQDGQDGIAMMMRKAGTEERGSRRHLTAMTPRASERVKYYITRNGPVYVYEVRKPESCIRRWTQMNADYQDRRKKIPICSTNVQTL